MALIRVDDVFVNESKQFVDFVVRLDAAVAQTVTVQTAMQNVTAQHTVDYIAANATLSFAPGEVSKTVRVELLPDTRLEGTEEFRLLLSNPVNATLADADGLAFIFDDDDPAGTPTASIVDATLDETGGAMQFLVLLSEPSASTVTLAYAPVSATATVGVDTQGGAGTVSFAPGEVMQTISIPIVNDALAERDEQFLVQLSSPVNASLGRSMGVGTIGASDEPAQVTPRVSVQSALAGESEPFVEHVFRLSAPSSRVVSVDYALANLTAQHTVDYMALSGKVTFEPGETTRTVRTPLLDDTRVENDEWFRISLSNPTNAVIGNGVGLVAIVDNDAPAGAPNISIADAVVDETSEFAVFDVTLDRPFASTLTLGYSTSGGTAAPGGDFLSATGTLSFAPGQTAQRVVVPIVDDAIAESDELFYVTLSAASAGSFADASATGLIGRSDGTVSASPVLSSRPVIVGESELYAEFVVRLDAPSNQVVTVNFANANGSAQHTADYMAQSGTLSFEPGETTRSVRVPLLEDAGQEAGQVFYFILSTPVNATLGTGTQVASIIDNDAASGAPVLHVSDAGVDETGGVASFTVWLDRPAGSILSVDYATVDAAAHAGSDFAATSGTLTFGPGETARTVLVPIIDDAAPEPDEVFYLQITNPSAGTLGDANGAGLIGRNDLASVSAPVISLRAQDSGENELYTEFLVELSAPSQQVVTVGMSNANITAQHTADYLARSDKLVFAPGETTQTVRIPLLQDTVAEPIQTYRLNLSNPTNASVPAANASLTVSIADDDSGPNAAQIDFGIFDPIRTEGDASNTVFLEIERRGDVSQSAAVSWAITGGAVDAADFGGVLPSGRIQFAPGETARLLPITVAGDTTLEPHENAPATLSAPFNASLWQSQATILLENDDPVPRSSPPDYGKDNAFLFDPVYYLWNNPDLVSSVSLSDAANHYLSGGFAQGREPNSYFDANYYKNRWPDLTPLNLDDATLFQHFNLFGVWEGRSPGPKFELLDGNRYLTDNPDVAAYVDAFIDDFLGSRTNGAIAHYIIYGDAEQRLAFDLNGGAVTLDYLWTG